MFRFESQHSSWCFTLSRPNPSSSRVLAISRKCGINRSPNFHCRYVYFGNHRDAWGYGAVDPSRYDHYRNFLLPLTYQTSFNSMDLLGRQFHWPANGSYRSIFLFKAKSCIKVISNELVSKTIALVNTPGTSLVARLS